HMAQLNGGSVENIDPGFQAIKSLKPNVLTFWTSTQQFESALLGGDAPVGIYNPNRAGALVKGGAPIGVVWPEEGAAVFGNAIGVVKDTKHRDLAEKYVNFALSTEVQQRFCEEALLAPVNSEVKIAE